LAATGGNGEALGRWRLLRPPAVGPAGGAIGLPCPADEPARITIGMKLGFRLGDNGAGDRADRRATRGVGIEPASRARTWRWRRMRRYRSYPEVRSDHHHASSFWTAPSLCADMIFGNDT